MLSAFNYSDSYIEKDNIDRTEIWEQEKLLISKQLKHLHIRYQKRYEKHNCPLCENEGSPIFEKEGFLFFQCSFCYSVFLPVEPLILEEYKNAIDILNYRNSVEYQENLLRQREVQWKELIEWLEFRTYRYLGKNRNLTITDFNNRFYHFREMIANSQMCSRYYSLENIEEHDYSNKADVLLYMAGIQQTDNPIGDLQILNTKIKKDGLLFLSSRLGTGFDILTLGAGVDKILPLEQVLLPSIKGMKIVMKKTGFSILEVVTPGNLDVAGVKDNIKDIEPNNHFMKYLFREGNTRTLNEFQRFLQKNKLSSYVQIIAKKE